MDKVQPSQGFRNTTRRRQIDVNMYKSNKGPLLSLLISRMLESLSSLIFLFIFNGSILSNWLH